MIILFVGMMLDCDIRVIAFENLFMYTRRIEPNRMMIVLDVMVLLEKMVVVDGMLVALGEEMMILMVNGMIYHFSY